MYDHITKFVDDIHGYLVSKCSDVPDHEREEIAAFIGYKAAIMLTETIIERDKQWIYANKKAERTARRESYKKG